MFMAAAARYSAAEKFGRRRRYFGHWRFVWLVLGYSAGRFILWPLA